MKGGEEEGESALKEFWEREKCLGLLCTVLTVCTISRVREGKRSEALSTIWQSCALLNSHPSPTQHALFPVASPKYGLALT